MSEQTGSAPQTEALPTPTGYVAANLSHEDSEWGKFEPHDAIFGQQPRKGWWPVWNEAALRAALAAPPLQVAPPLRYSPCLKFASFGPDTVTLPDMKLDPAGDFVAFDAAAPIVAPPEIQGDALGNETERSGEPTLAMIYAGGDCITAEVLAAMVAEELDPDDVAIRIFKAMNAASQPATARSDEQETSAPQGKGQVEAMPIPVNIRLRACLGFLKSVIQSGEPWTATCEAMYNQAVADTPLAVEAMPVALQMAVQTLRAALNDAAYALFQIKRMTPEAVREFAAAAHEKACSVLNGVPQHPTTPVAPQVPEES